MDSEFLSDSWFFCNAESMAVTSVALIRLESILIALVLNGSEGKFGLLLEGSIMVSFGPFVVLFVAVVTP